MNLRFNVSKKKKNLVSEVQNGPIHKMISSNGLKDIVNLGNNLSKVRLQMDSIKMLNNKIDDIYYLIFIEYHKKSSKIDIEKVSDLIEILTKVNKQLITMVSTVNSVLFSFILEESHELHKSSGNIKYIMEAIYGETRDIQNETNEIYHKVDFIKTQLDDVIDFITMLEYKRELKKK
ncbi:MAG: hypothetical protein Q8Q35_01300 [Nanoarchaeota archaeon]|nr:hypothetical protein [Nanoarchaeota archaeon]